MPTYEYECLKCEHKFEARQSITESPLKKCPVCGEAVKKLISAGAGIIFKGSGFYATDYRSKGYRESAKSENVSCPEATKACSSSGCPKAK